jgi:hypothetical protein
MLVTGKLNMSAQQHDAKPDPVPISKMVRGINPNLDNHFLNRFTQFAKYTGWSECPAPP